MRSQGGKNDRVRRAGRAVPRGGVRRRDAAHSTTWTRRANRSGRESTAPRGYAPERGCRRVWRRRTSYTPGAARLETRGQRRGLLSRFLRRKRGLRSSAPQGPVLRARSRGSGARRRPGPRARRDASEMNGSPRAPLPRPGRLPRPRLTFPGGGGGSGGGRGRRSGAGRAGAVRFLSAPRHPDGEGGESGAAGKTLKVTL